MRQLRIALLLLLLVPRMAQALNYSVPYARDGLNGQVFFDTLGWGANIGHLEVNNAGDANTIDFHANDPTYGLQTYVDVRDFSGLPLSTSDYAHGTLVAHVMGSLYTANSTGIVPYASSTAILNLGGMAPQASYHGALFNGADDKTGFLSLNNSLNSLIATSHVQAINHSWGGNVSDASQLNGSSAYALLMDEYTGYRGKTSGTTGHYTDTLMVFAAGNNGEDTGLLGTPADSFNGLTVGALDVGTPSNILFDPQRAPAPRVASFSSWRPLADGRSGVDVVAPGTSLAIITRLVLGPESNQTWPIQVLEGVLGNGTSFAAPHVTGVAAMLYGSRYVPWDYYYNIVSVLTSTAKGTSLATDHKLMKAILINSADKIPGLDSNGVAQVTWQPGWVENVNGVSTALAPLNYAVGAGEVNANDAYLTYYEVGNRFWALSTLTTAGQTDYYTLGEGKFNIANPNQPDLYGLTATLVWDRHIDFTVNTDTNNPSFGAVDKDLLSELALYLQRQISPGLWTNVFISAAVPSSLQHIYMPVVPTNGLYRLAVRANTLADPSIGEEYALAVEFIMVPEPSGWLLVVTGAAVLRFGRRRAQPRGRDPNR
jgi:hypothetical protein